jgi:microcystin-dependent protein
MNFSKTLKLSAAGIALAMGASTSMACSSNGYIGTVTVFAGNFAIRNCAFTNGSLLSIASNNALFSILGTTYGGDGRSTFGLPDTRGRSVVGAGNGPGLTNVRLGERGGAEKRTLTASNLPAHSHAATTNVTITANVHASTIEGDTDNPNGAVWSKLSQWEQYYTGTPNVTMASDAVTVSTTATTTTSNTGSGTSFSIRDPYVGMYWLIQLTGLYPSRN